MSRASFPFPPSGIGLIEGFFGKSWSWPMRLDYASWLAGAGYHFYIYAPKDDPYLRRQWYLPWPQSMLDELKRLRAACRENGIAFGIGLTPLGAHHDYENKRALLLERVADIDAELAPDILAVLFDDMPSDTPQLARLQLQIAHDIAATTRARKLIFCPSFYSTDPILEKVFGAMPAGYWQELGSGLDPAFSLFWTGPKVCSSDYPVEHLAWVADTLKRRPFLWDNYPVNDGKRASNFLYLDAFRHRPATLADYLCGHAVNPMKQAALSRLPLATLPACYLQGDAYDPDTAWSVTAQKRLGDELSSLLLEDLSLLSTTGLDKLDDAHKERLTCRYRPFAQQYQEASELIGWLNGDYQFDPACLTD